MDGFYTVYQYFNFLHISKTLGIITIDLSCDYLVLVRSRSPVTSSPSMTNLPSHKSVPFLPRSNYCLVSLRNRREEKPAKSALKNSLSTSFKPRATSFIPLECPKMFDAAKTSLLLHRFLNTKRSADRDGSRNDSAAKYN